MTHLITRLGHQGDGIADGPLYAARTLPGEVVTGEVQGDRIPAPKIVTPSTDRVTPPCRHFRRCGGCKLQHGSDAFVAAWKQGIVREMLARAGIVPDFTAAAISPWNSRRRAALSGRKTKKGAQVGFHVAGGHDIVEIPNCKLLHPAILSALPCLEEITRIAAPRGTEVTLHVTHGLTGLDLSIETPKPFDRAAMLALAVHANAFARITWNDEVALQQTPPAQAMGAAWVVPPPGAFLQATPQGEAALVAGMRTALADSKRVVDLFAGCGTFTFPAAETAAIHAVEGDRTLIDALTQGARHASGLKAITSEVRDLFREPLLPEELSAYDAAIIDPPRAGAEAQVAQLAASDITRIAFVSCNPATFAGEAETLIAAGFRMGPVTVVDQFRWSPHIELVTSFSRT